MKYIMEDPKKRSWKIGVVYDLEDNEKIQEIITGETRWHTWMKSERLESLDVKKIKPFFFEATFVQEWSNEIQSEVGSWFQEKGSKINYNFGDKGFGQLFAAALDGRLTINEPEEGETYSFSGFFSVAKRGTVVYVRVLSEKEYQCIQDVWQENQ